MHFFRLKSLLKSIVDESFLTGLGGSLILASIVCAFYCLVALKPVDVPPRYFPFPILQYQILEDELEVLESKGKALRNPFTGRWCIEPEYRDKKGSFGLTSSLLYEWRGFNLNDIPKPSYIQSYELEELDEWMYENSARTGFELRPDFDLVEEEGQYERCALIGSESIAVINEYGSEIDDYDFVIRFDATPRGGFERYTGQTTDVRLQSTPYCGATHSVGEVAKFLCVVYDREDYKRDRENHKVRDGHSWGTQLSIHRMYFSSLARNLIRPLIPALPMYELNPQFVSYLKDKLELEKPSVESIGVAYAMQVCQSIDLYGFTVGTALQPESPLKVPSQDLFYLNEAYLKAKSGNQEGDTLTHIKAWDYQYEKAHLRTTYSSHIPEFFMLNLGLARGQIVNKMICEEHDYKQ